MHCQTVSSQSLSERSVVNLNVLLPVFTAPGDLRAVAACAVTGGAVDGRAGEPLARAKERGVCEPPEIQRPPFSSILVSRVSVGAYCSPSVSTHGGDPLRAVRCK